MIIIFNLITFKIMSNSIYYCQPKKKMTVNIMEIVKRAFNAKTLIV